MRVSGTRFRLGTKLAIANAALLLLVAGALAASTYWQLRTSQRQAMRDRLNAILELAAAPVDGDIHTLIQSASDVDGPYYNIIEDQLTTLADSNPDILRIYTLRTAADSVHRAVVSGKVSGSKDARVRFGEVHEAPLAALGKSSAPPDRCRARG